MERPEARARWPLVTLALVAAGALLACRPELARPLAFERAALRAEPWRALTGQLVHGSAQHAALDLVVLALLGTWWERRSRAAYLALLAASAAGVAAALVFFSTLERYTGSSGIVAGLFVGAALELVLAGRGAGRGLGAAALVLFAAKCALEARAGTPVFAALPPGTEVAVAAHVGGALGGALSAAAVVLLGRRPGAR